MGSTKETETRMKKNNITLLIPDKGNTFQLSLLYGTLLGDAYLYPHNGIIQIEQSLGHKEYLFWLFGKLKTLTTGKPPSLVTRTDRRTGKETQSYRFYTRAFFHEWRPHFYSFDGVKKLPDNFENDIDPVSLLIWFMDDGGKSTGVKMGVFYTLDNYSQYDIELFKHLLWARFRIVSHIHRSGQSKSGRVQKRLSITGKDCVLFYNIINPVLNCIPPFVLKCFPKFS